MPSEIDTSAEELARLMAAHDEGRAHDCRGFTELELAASALVAALAAERDAAILRAEQAERREAALLASSEEARQSLRQRDTLRAEVASLRAALRAIRDISGGPIRAIAEAALEEVEHG